MTLTTIAALEIGPAIAKNILKIWFRDSSVGEAIGSGLVDAIKKKTNNAFEQLKTARQLEDIGARVAESLCGLFEREGSAVDENGINAIAIAVAKTLGESQISADLLLDRDLNPAKLEAYFLADKAVVTRDFSEKEAALYSRIISEASQDIVDIGAQLPQFTEKTFAEILRRENVLLDVATKILDEVRAIRVGTANMHAEHTASQFEVQYLRAVQRALDRLELFGIDLPSSNQRHRLSVAYVTLSAQSRGPIESRSVAKSEEQISISQERPAIEARHGLRIDDVIRRHKRLVIRGAAGSGKTTLLQWIAVSCASRDGRAIPDFTDTIPFFIRLRQCAGTGFPTPEQFPRFIANTVIALMPPGWVHDQLQSGRAVVLIDGVDEVPQLNRNNVRTWLTSLADVYPLARFVITSRPSAVVEGWMESEKFNEAELQPMELADIYAFIDHWHDAVIAETPDSDERNDETRSQASRLKDNVTKKHALRNLATSPLLCAVLCALNRERHQKLPASRIELYDACCHMLLERRDAEREVNLQDYPSLTYTLKRRVLADIAYYMIRNGLSMMPLAEVETNVSQKRSAMQGVPAEVSSSSILQFLLDRSGIVREPITGWFDFTHRTFQEFLAARAVVDEADIGVLIKHAHDDQWREVVILAAGLAGERHSDALFNGILKRAETEQEFRHQLNLLSVACLETTVTLGDDVRRVVKRNLSELVPPVNLEQAKSLASAGDLSVPHLAFRPEMAKASKLASILALQLIQTSAALEALQPYACDPNLDNESLQALLAGWNSFDRVKYAQSILSPALEAEPRIILRGQRDLTGIEYLTNTCFLRLVECVIGCSCLAPLRTLEELDLIDCDVHEWESISYLKNLKKLTIYGNMATFNTNSLQYLSELTHLRLHGLELLQDIDGLAHLTKLQELSLRACPQLIDLSPLEGAQNLERVIINDCPALINYGPLHDPAIFHPATLSGKYEKVTPVSLTYFM